MRGCADLNHRVHDGWSVPAMIFCTYCRERPFTTRQTGRWVRSSRWWLAQKRTRLTTGNAIVCSNGTLRVGSAS